MTEDKQPQKLSEENCADFLDRIHLESLSRRWASVVIGRHGRSRQDIGKREVLPTPVARPAQDAAAEPGS